MNVRSYAGKIFIVESSKTVIRDDNLSPSKYQPGDEIPPGKQVGDLKVIPQRTEIVVTDVKADADRHVFVFARPAKDPTSVFGWTSAANLVGSFANETTGFAPASWQREPDGTSKTCIDAQAVLRTGPPTFAATGNTIPQKSFVQVIETSADNLNVRVRRLKIVDGNAIAGDELGWTRASNLRDGCAEFFFSDEWLDQKGPNACWDHGAYIGAKLLVNIVGFGGEMEQVTFDSLNPYLTMMKAAEDEANLQLSINSAFRTFRRQAELFALFKAGKGNKAAPAGASNHQHGQAFDLNTQHNVVNGTDKIYEWLKRNGPRHGFVRAVSNETWHWEYRPVVAGQLPPGKFMMPGIHDG